MRFSAIVLAAALAACVGACSSSPKPVEGDGSKASMVEAEAKPAEKVDLDSQPLPICPQVAVVRGLDTFLRTKQGEAYNERDVKPQALVAGARMTRVKGDCTYGKRGVDAKFKLSMVGARGPLLDGLKASFPYFVAVVDPSGRVIEKLAYSAEIGFSSEKRAMDHDEALRVHIPLELKDRASGAAYQVLMGFQRGKNKEVE
ncbi:MAG: hypothetical protein ABTQ34_09840 [Bdellovibrionales bacterium]